MENFTTPFIYYVLWYEYETTRFIGMHKSQLQREWVCLFVLTDVRLRKMCEDNNGHSNHRRRV